MLSLDKPFVVDGITVYRDHADPSRFWYLPGRVSLAHRTDGAPALSLLTYRPAQAGGAAKGGGFMMFESTLELPRSTLSKIEARVSSEAGVVLPISLATPPFENGTVQCIALDLQGSAGTQATPGPEGTFRATEQILGATVPTMDAANRAAFNLVLSQEGAVIMEQALTQGLTPVGVVYSLQYLALRPALDVTITAHLEQVYTALSASIEGQYMYLKAGLEAALEWLKAQGAITIEVHAFTDAADLKEQEKWALQLFTDHLLADWFTPTLDPGKTTGGSPAPHPSGGNPPPNPAPNPTPNPTPNPSGGNPTPNPTPNPAPNPAPASGGPAAGVTVAVPPSPPAAPPAVPPAAVLQQQSTSPAPLPAGLSVTHVPSTSGTTETLRVSGAGATVRVAGQEVALGPDGSVTRAVNPGESLPVQVSWPAPAAADTFCLFFDMDKPAENGWSTQPPSAEFRSYVENTTTDPRFRSATGLQQLQGDGAWTGPEQGADRLARWISQLPAPRQVEVRGYASHEHTLPETDDARAAYNLRLSRRRLDVAVALVRRAGGDPVVSQALGDTVSAARPGAHDPFGGDPDNRVAQLQPRQTASGATWTGVLQRASAPDPAPGPNGGNPTPTPTPNPNGGSPTPTPNPSGGHPTPTPNPSGGNPGSTSLPTLAAFKLRFVRQEERKDLTLRYQRTEAVRQTLAPQGFLGLLAGDLDAAEKVVTLIDLDHRFFRQLDVTASMPGQVADLGLTEAQLAIDYGPADHVRHGDLVFTPTQTAPQTFSTFLDDKLTLCYDARLELTFDATAGWDGDALRYSIPLPGSTDRDVVINPYEHLDLRTISVEPGDVDWEVVSSIDVQLTATGYGDRPLRRLVTLRQDSAGQTWRLRGALPAPADRGVSVVLVQTLTDGTVERTDPAPVDLSLVRVDDLFTDALELVLVPSFPAAGVDRVVIDVDYLDEAHHYHRTLRPEIPGTSTEPLRLRIALRDPTRREVQVRFTFVGPGLFDQRPFVTTTEQVLPIR